MAFGGSSELNIQGTTLKKSSSTQRVFDQAAIDRLIFSALGADQGLASLASGENLSGGFNSSTKTLQTQDFLTKLIGELAIASAPVVTKERGDTTTKESKNKAVAKTVICTELARRKLLDQELYEAGGPPSRQVSKTVWVGYHVWAVRVVPLMQRSWMFSWLLLPVVYSRYQFLLGRPGVNLLGRLSVYLGHPICYVIGRIVNRGNRYGRLNEFT